MSTNRLALISIALVLGLLPARFPVTATTASQVAETTPDRKPFPVHWGNPPQIQTRDLRELPGGYGMGSSTLAKWIQGNLDKDAAAAAPVPAKPLTPLIQPRQSDGQGTISISGSTSINWG